MKTSKKIIISMNLNSMSLNDVPRLSKEWLEYRIDIFMKYTYKSLINQTNQNFLAIINYDVKSHDTIKNILSKYKKLQSNIIFTPAKSIIKKEGFCENNLVNRYIKGYDYLYLVTLDTDNMYHPSFVDKLINLKVNPKTQCVISQRGYVYDTIDNNLGVWISISPSFYTLIYKSSDFLNGVRYEIPSHASAYTLIHEYIKDPTFLVTIHESNARSKFKMYNLSTVITDLNMKKSILKGFNIYIK